MKTLVLRLGVLVVALCAPTTFWAQLCHPLIPKIAVTTYHYDTLRTGWNSHEVLLNPTLKRPIPPNCPVLQPAVFGLAKKVTLDDTVYAQPLVVPDVTMPGGSQPGKHDVVYVVTENNTIFAIDGNTGDVLLTRNLGPAVLVPNCANNGPRVGIESTPVIDLGRQVMYLISYTMHSGQPAYLAHVIDLATLADKSPPIVVSASHTENGQTITFNASIQRQRPGLLLLDGNLYAAFGSFCDHDDARGWLIRFRTIPNLLQFASTRLTNVSRDHWLSSIWMSGYGVAGVPGEVYFATGNSDARAYDIHHNASETVMKVASDFSNALDFFTPTNVGLLDGDLTGTRVDPDFNPDVTWSHDLDFGSGGVLLLPDQQGGTPRLATAAGKEGWMYLLNRDSMGRFDGAADNALGKYRIGACFCGESYYLNKVVTSGGTELGVWQVYTSPSPGLTKVASADLATLIGGWRDGGFFTAISSNGEADAIIWAVSRHHSFSGGPVPTLFAFQVIPGDAQPKLLFQSAAGNWDVPHPQNIQDGANSNIVPVVANGHVYVASFKELDIFGFIESGVVAGIGSPVAATAVREVPRTDFSKYNGGTIMKLDGPQLTMRTEAGAEVRVDATQAIRRGLSPVLVVGQTISVYGSTDVRGVFHAEVIKSTIGKKPQP